MKTAAPTGFVALELGIDSPILTDPHGSAIACYGVVKRDRPIGSCRYSRLRCDQGGDRGGNGFPLFQADCGCEVAGSAPGAAKAPYSETQHHVEQLGRADVGPYGARALGVSDRADLSDVRPLQLLGLRRGPACLQAEPRTACPAVSIHRDHSREG